MTTSCSCCTVGYDVSYRDVFVNYSAAKLLNNPNPGVSPVGILFAVGSHVAIILFGGLGLRLRVDG